MRIVSCKFPVEKQEKREEATQAVPSSMPLSLVWCCSTSHSKKHQSTLFFSILTFLWLIKFSLSYLSSVVCFYINVSYPKFSRSFPFPFQGLISFSESLLRLLGSFPPSFYSTVCARLSLAPCFCGYLTACSL